MRMSNSKRRILLARIAHRGTEARPRSVPAKLSTIELVAELGGPCFGGGMCDQDRAGLRLHSPLMKGIHVIERVTKTDYRALYPYIKQAAEEQPEKHKKAYEIFENAHRLGWTDREVGRLIDPLIDDSDTITISNTLAHAIEANEAKLSVPPPRISHRPHHQPPTGDIVEESP